MSLKISLAKQDKKSNTGVFLIEGATPAFVNAIRRTILDSVPTLAIHEVEFTKNSSALYDEMIAHRLGLVTLTTDLKTYKPLEAGQTLEEAPLSSTCKLWMKAKGPGYAYAGDLESKDPSVKPVFGKTPIVKLLKGQEIEFEATAVIGTGKQHMKWAPAHVWHSHVPKLTINHKHPEMDAFKGSFPPQAFKNGKLDAEAIEENNLYDAVGAVNPEICKVEYEKDKFLLHIESFGSLKIKEILSSALEQLKSRFELLQESTKAWD